MSTAIPSAPVSALSPYDEVQASQPPAVRHPFPEKRKGLLDALRRALGRRARVERAITGFVLVDPGGDLDPQLRGAVEHHPEAQSLLEEAYVLGPILAPCPLCSDTRYWYNWGTARQWQCFTCMSPGLMHGPVWRLDTVPMAPKKD